MTEACCIEGCSHLATKHALVELFTGGISTSFAEPDCPLCEEHAAQFTLDDLICEHVWEEICANTIRSGLPRPDSCALAIWPLDGEESRYVH